jgi:hypothetical protein
MPKFSDDSETFLNEIIAMLRNLNIDIENESVNFAEEFGKDVDVWEKYTLRSHTLLVLNQFSKYDIYNNQAFPDWLDKKSFRIFLVLHDIGKPFAIKRGSKKNQGIYNKIFVENILSKLGVPNTKFFAELVSEDIIGKYIKEKCSLDESISAIAEHASNSGMDIKKFYISLMILFMCDAGSYTKDSGGLESLDWLFQFDPIGRELSFSEKIYPKIKILDEMIRKA